MKILREDFEEILYSPETKKISEGSYKHDVHTETYVTKIEDKYYLFVIFVSYNNGIEIDDDINCVEVKPVEKTIIEWVPV